MFKQNESFVYQEHGAINGIYFNAFLVTMYYLESLILALFISFFIVVYVSVEDPGSCCNIGYCEFPSGSDEIRFWLCKRGPCWLSLLVQRDGHGGLKLQ